MIYSTLSRFHAIRISEDDYGVVKGKFNSHFVKRTNVIYKRAMFNRRIQEEGEAVDVFITALYAQAEKCAYGEEMIRDKIVVGIRDTGLLQLLQLDPDLTLQKAVTQTREAESVKSQQSAILSDSEQGEQGEDCTGSSDFRNNLAVNLAVTDVGNRPSMTDSNVLPKKPSVELVAIIKQYVEQRTLEKFITKR